jgi:bacillithiol biosynthesis cysteine-adding enzyme BshC
MFVNFCDIPGHHNLFLDYLYEFDNVSEYYTHSFRNKDNYLKVIRNITESTYNISSQISSVLKQQYSSVNSSELTQKNIELLSQPKTVAIVTGQQLGIFGGPLYTFYKAITAIKLSKYLSERYDDNNFVPVFWMESDDHDFNEVRSTKIIDDNNNTINLDYAEELDEDEAKQSVGHLKLDDSINNLFKALNGTLRDTEFKQPLINLLKKSYKVGNTFKDAFKELLLALFDEYGLVLLDPQDKNIKELLKPIFKKEIIDFRQHTEKLVYISAKLEEIYHAQVKVKPVNLFLAVDDGRFSIEPVENEFRLKRKRKSFTQEQLVEIVENEPERLSPNVLLRPICQDYLLSTAFYIAGPSEISYFAQVQPLYELYNLTAPIIYPRSSATIVEQSIAKTLDKHDISINEIFIDVESLKKKIVDSVAETSVEDVFANISNEVELAFDRLRENLFDLDKTIADGSKKYRDKIINSLNELKSKAEKAQQKKYEVTLRQIDRAAANIFPNSNLQERELNYINFANKYGDEFLKHVFNEIQINKFEHQIIEL